MRQGGDSEPIRLAIAVDDPGLADRLAKMLAGLPDLQLVAASEKADAVLVMPHEETHPAGGDASLTPREIEVLRLLAEGASNKEIARRLGISAHTAKFHVGSLLNKLDAVGRTDAVAHAARIGVIRL
ncbi:MAG TPA: helix-turn-helix transcriptional regulator [Microvirga sp.]|nr:helix-turn-helix transcriptional regulator [Microvirga sp.]